MRVRGALLAAAAAAVVLAGCGGGGSATTKSGATSVVDTGAGPSSTPSSTSTVQLTTPTGTASTTTTSSTTSTSASPTSTSPSGGASLAPGFSLSSSAFSAGAAIPSQYTCDGQDISPPLTWSGVPAGTKELVLVVRDPDAPSGPLVHWALAGIPPDTASFPAGGVSGQVVPGRNSFGSLGYRGPCPPTGDKPHHYVFTLSALATPSGLGSGFSADQLQSRALGIATLTGTFGRP